MADRAVRRSARHRCNGYRAIVERPNDMESIAENAQDDWNRACMWASVALGLTFGPMLALGISWGWM